jgi:hypothetical protein
MVSGIFKYFLDKISAANQNKYNQGGTDINYGPTGHFKFSASPNQGSAPAPTPWPTLPAPWYGQPSGHRIPAFTGYDITNMLRSQMPREMAEIQLSSVVDQAQGGHSNLLDAITAIQQRNFEQYGQPTSYRSVQPDSSGRYIDPLRNNANRNVPQNPAVALNRPQYNNVATDYYSNRNNYLPGIAGLLGGI